MNWELPNKVAAFYQFVRLDQPAAVREEFLGLCGSEIWGTVLVSPEGINGTLAGGPEAIDAFVAALRRPAAHRPAFDRLELKISTAGTEHFDRLKIKLKREIITFRNATVDPARPGQYVDPNDWNALLADPEVLLLDTRNTYETAIGTFAGAVTPPLDTFSDFSDYVREHLDPTRHRKVAMFCTGGIRCEKASAYMLQQGFPEVYHLKGGILKYLEEVPTASSQWQGACYIFDERISVDHEDFNR